MESCKCPITDEIFEDPVVGDDGHTYERKAITEWLTKNETSPITRQPMHIDSLKTNYVVKKMIEEFRSNPQAQQAQCQFKLDVDIRKTRTRPLFQGFGKTIYEVEWISRTGPPIILLKIDGAKANREASFYVQLSCHPNIVRTFGLVQCNPGSVMLLQECAPHGDLSELLRENGFKPTEQVLRRIFEQICDAMICLVDNGIIHGDLACRNVLVFRSNSNEPKENLVKLTDFGLTRGSTVYSMVDSPSMSTMTIIPMRYVAPEILRNPDRPNYSEKSDVYSMGVLMWEACSYGQLPYSSLHDDSDVRKRKLNDERLSQPSQCSHQLWTIINECWHQKTSKRPSFTNLKESLLTVHIESTHSRQQTPSPMSLDFQVSCREGEKQRLEDRARIISQETITAQFPCEYCQQLFSAHDLHSHQSNCHQTIHNQAQIAFQPYPSTQNQRANKNRNQSLPQQQLTPSNQAKSTRNQQSRRHLSISLESAVSSGQQPSLVHQSISSENARSSRQQPTLVHHSPSSDYESSSTQKPSLRRQSPSSDYGSSSTQKPSLRRQSPSSGYASYSRRKPSLRRQSPSSDYESSSTQKPSLRRQSPSSGYASYSRRKPSLRRQSPSSDYESSSKRKSSLRRQSPSSDYRSSSTQKPSLRRQSPSSGYASYSRRKPSLRRQSPSSDYESSSKRKSSLRRQSTSSDYGSYSRRKSSLRHQSPSSDYESSSKRKSSLRRQSPSSDYGSYSRRKPSFRAQSPSSGYGGYSRRKPSLRTQSPSSDYESSSKRKPSLRRQSPSSGYGSYSSRRKPSLRRQSPSSGYGSSSKRKSSLRHQSPSSDYGSYSRRKPSSDYGSYSRRKPSSDYGSSSIHKPSPRH